MYSEKEKKYKRKYYIKNKERIRARQKKYEKAHRKEKREYIKEWEKYNKHRLKKYQQKHMVYSRQIGANRATCAVYWAVRKGLLPFLKDGSIKCVDCNGVATQYDHRDYSKPLEVEPVCQSCNILRGKAKPFRRTHRKERWLCNGH